MKVGLLIRWLVKINFQCSTDWPRHLVSVTRQSSLEKKCLQAHVKKVLLGKGVCRKKEALLT
jgi:hypothetical protein